MKDLDIGSSSLDDLETAVNEILDSAKAVATAAKEVTSEDVSELQASATSLSTALEDFPSPSSVQAIATGLGTIAATADKALTDLDCKTDS
jgi:hypothetical protein